MSSVRRREAMVLGAAGALALLVPLVASHYLSLRIRGGLEPALERRLGVDVDIGSIDASFTGVVRLRDIRVGDVFAARSVEAAVGIGPLVSGTLYLDEVRVDRPRLRVVRRRDGSTNVERLLARLRSTSRSRKPGGARRRSRIGRAVVTGGELVVEVAGRGHIRARDVELVSQPGGTRLITGELAFQGHYAGARAEARFVRAAADLQLLRLRASRLLAVGGDVTLMTPYGHVVHLRDAALSRAIRTADGALVLRGNVRHRTGVSRVDVAAFARPARLRVSGDALPLAALVGPTGDSLDLSRAFADGAIELELVGGGGLRVTSSADLRGLRIDNAHVASVPVVVDGRVDVDAEVKPDGDGHRLQLRRLRITRTGATLLVRGDAHWARGARLPVRAELTAELPTAECQRTLTALPLAMRDRLAGLRARGSLSGDMALRFNRSAGDTHLSVDVDMSRCRVEREPYYADARRLKRRSYRHILPTGEHRRLNRRAKGYVRLRSLPRHVPRAFISGEDARFFRHGGFDPQQIERSLAIDLREAQFRRGGSTISQQLVKNLFLTHRRTLARKFQEAVLTWRLEHYLSKREILERYLNIIELGPGVYGIEAAARHWFNKRARKLSLREAAFLAALTPAPTTIAKRIRAAGGVDPATRQRVRAILRAMRRDRAINRSDYRRAKRDRLELHVAKLARN